MGGLQKINWLQIDTENVPNGEPINLGSNSTPINDGHFNSLLINDVPVLKILNQFLYNDEFILILDENNNLIID